MLHLILVLVGAALIGLLAGALTRKLAARWRSFTVMVFLVGALPVSRAAVDRVERAFEDPFDREMRLLLTEDPTGKDWAAKRNTTTAPLDDAWILAGRGFRRLDDAQLDRRFVLSRKLLDRSPPRRCAAIARGTGPPAELMASLKVLTKEEQGEFARIVVAAARAEMQDAPPVKSLSPERSAAVDKRIEDDLARPENKEVLATLSNASAASDEAICAATRYLLAFVAALHGEERAAGVRVMTLPTGD
jgi:hypothetical protein